MANDYYNASTTAQPLTIIRSGDFNSNNDEVVVGFDRLPNELDVKRTQFGTDNSLSGALYEITAPYLTVPYYDGLEITFQAAFTNTASANISVNGNPIVALSDAVGAPVAAGQIKANQAVTVIYLSNQNLFQIISTSALSDDAASAAQSAAEAAASAAAALISENNAANSAAASLISETNAGNSELAASGSAAAALTSENNAANSAAAAAISEANAAASAASLKPATELTATTGNLTIVGDTAYEYVVTRVGTGNGTISIDTSTLVQGDKITVFNVLETSGIATIINLDGTINLPDGTSSPSNTLTGKGSAFFQKIDGTNDLTVVSVQG